MTEGLDNLVRLEEQRVTALQNQDARAYTMICDQLGLTDIEDPFLYDSGAGYDKAEELYFSQLADDMLEQEMSVKKPRKKRIRKKQAEYNALRAAADNSRVNVYNVFEDTEIKIKHLKELMGYNHLWVGKDEKIDLRDAKPTRIGEAYKKCYDMGE